MHRRPKDFENLNAPRLKLTKFQFINSSWNWGVSRRSRTSAFCNNPLTYIYLSFYHFPGAMLGKNIQWRPKYTLIKFTTVQLSLQSTSIAIQACLNENRKELKKLDNITKCLIWATIFRKTHSWLWTQKCCCKYYFNNKWDVTW